MTLRYVGERAFDRRLAEFNYTEKEEERFDRIAHQLEDEGYKVDSGVEFWAAIEVEDRKEFEEVKRAFQRLRREIK